MPKSIQRLSLVALGFAVAVIGISCLGAFQPENNVPQRTIDYDPLLGGLGGMLTITDSDDQKAYLYVMPPEFGSDKAEAKPSAPQLVGTIDMATAGQEKLTVEFRNLPRGEN